MEIIKDIKNNAKITIEKLTNTNTEPMGVLQKILTTPGIALAATGSAGCIRSIYLTAKKLHRLSFLYAQALSLADYSLGRNEHTMRQCIEAAVNHPDVRGVIAYASCLDLLSYWQEDNIMTNINNPRHIPVAILYRGPLIKRQLSPIQQLEKIYKKFGLPDIGTSLPLNISSLTKITDSLPDGFNEPNQPDYEVIINSICSKHIPCNILLLTPGGCKSCLTKQLSNFAENTLVNIYYTRFNDVSLVKCTANDFLQSILKTIPQNSPLVILPTAILQTIGFDTVELCNKLKSHGFTADYINTTGFKNSNLNFLLEKVQDLG